METTNKILKYSALEQLIGLLNGTGRQLMAPVRKGKLVELEQVNSLGEIAFDALLTTQSAKKTAKKQPRKKGQVQ